MREKQSKIVGGMAREHRRVAIVTGGGRRLGRRIALALSEEGFKLVINYNESRKGAIDTVKLIRSRGGESIAVKADIARKGEVNRLVRSALRSYGRIDLLVNNAARFNQSTLETTTEDLWDDALNVNLKGSFLCAQAIGLHMKKQGSGRIINIASLGGIQAWSKHLPYSISKAAVIMLTRVLAKALAPEVDVNAIAPGTIIIPGEEDPSLEHVSLRSIPLQRYGTPEDITNAVLFLALSASYMTGQVLVVDGGRSIH